MSQSNERQGALEVPGPRRIRCSGPVLVGACFAGLAILLTLLGLWRAHNLSLQNVLLAIVLCGGVWGLVSWAIATAVVQVEEDVASGSDEDD